MLEDSKTAFPHRGDVVALQAIQTSLLLAAEK